ncbi:unnamed protein product, partial [Staurois parvus]
MQKNKKSMETFLKSSQPLRYITTCRLHQQKSAKSGLKLFKLSPKLEN